MFSLNMYCVYLALSECYCAGWRYQDVTCELSALDIIFFQSLFHLDRCFCHCSNRPNSDVRFIVARCCVPNQKLDY